MTYAVPFSAPRSRAGCDNCTKGVPIALTLRRLNLRVVSPLLLLAGRTRRTVSGRSCLPTLNRVPVHPVPNVIIKTKWLPLPSWVPMHPGPNGSRQFIK
jgi:hypothetical protein